MNANVQTSLAEEQRKPQARVRSREYGWNIFLLVIVVILTIGYLVSTQKWYKPGDDIGYNMGLVGGIMLLMLLLYPLRKRVRFLRSLGILPIWFKWHMIFGILAPTLILFHSTFYIGSINAGMALVAMLLVAGSGVFGRFFYTKIHNGLYGRQANLKELQEEMAETGNVKSVLGFAPGIEKALDEFRARTAKVSKGGDAGLWHFATIGIRAVLLSRSLVRQLHHAMYSPAKEKNWNAAQMQRLEIMFGENKKQVDLYIRAVRDVAQFHTYERLFSWWHIFHIPLVYLLVFSGIFHVISVHMY
ncbi:MAG: hypothetical protein B7Y56_13670 [Gallionellales bacterium 35-53-114]|jgi:hypothetical protein|nr:MAG: hypothetical protein B7Y56_13670 [Gallionellales bacterium 35-53-114]OYZ63022.1 MAG: hypothetical protein B7Y04_11145 [Gallionellales bacterium 24-53-125]OZB08996.1 MAG: hypothetical protein B7X61_08455 [Gallionellales bacterium 39-52-133]